MRFVPRPCLDCGSLTTAGSRCVYCEQRREQRRNSLPHRQAYVDPIYKSMVPSGMCYWCGKRPATTRDHRVRLIDGGSNSPDNIVFACEQCNYGRGNSQERES